MVIPGKIRGDGSNESGGLLTSVAGDEERKQDAKNKRKAAKHAALEDAPGSEAPAKQKGTKDNVKKQKITKAVTAHDDPKKLEDSKANRQIQKITGTVTKPDGATIWKHKPCYSIEICRSQITCRTGWLGKGQNHLITFAAAGGVEAARAQAETWVAAERIRQGVV